MFTLVIGGAASGKSEYAESLLLGAPGPRYYLATMEPMEDAECRARIEKHRRQRAGKGFVTIERGVDLAGLALPARGDVLLEDLGNLAANELFGEERPDLEGAFRRIQAGLASVQKQSEHLVVISNDIHRDGVGYPPETECYLDLLSRLHQELAAQADLVVEVVCGLPVFWKGGWE